ncbi:MAG: YfhO family protein [Anaerolineae bacterium]|nr:YfhO family protein [Anaerolineae bacterium]MDW8173201.1 YfhO family protein [Anaerolineae bacterium]
MASSSPKPTNVLARASRYPDVIALAILALAWVFFFWRVLTPNPADQLVFRQGDFSGQFVAFAGYQYRRFAAGEVPLWNPYNNAGLPFIADTQAAVFYPPRLLVLALAHLSGGFSVQALQLEALLHVGLASVFVYVFVRRLTWSEPTSPCSGLASGLVLAYGGYINGYPPLQLALLEAGVWFPLAALCLLEATRGPRLAWRWAWSAGLVLGVSWMAGHPQTSWFVTYWLMAWLAYRVWLGKMGWRTWLVGTGIMGLVSLGATAITLLPGLEYLLLTSRAELGFDAKGNGFPFQDVIQFIWPGLVSLFSPLYVGLPTLLLSYAALRAWPGAAFWGWSAAFGLLLSFGANTAFYGLLYWIMPGLSFFRGQERAAFFVAYGLAILAGLGLAALARQDVLRWRAVLVGFSAALLMLALLAVFAWLGFPRQYNALAPVASFSAMIALLSLAVLWHWPQPKPILIAALLALIAFELFSVNMNAESNYGHPDQLISLEPPPLVQMILDQPHDQPFRVDGFRGLHDNFGSLYGLADMRGISPLFLTSVARTVYAHYVYNPLAWELWAVRYVFSERESFSTPTRLLAQGTDREGVVYLHELDDPRPFAYLLTRYVAVDSDAFAQALLSDPRFDPRQEIILLNPPKLDMPSVLPTDAQARVIEFQPERVTISSSASTPALLSLAMPHYPGWRATIDEMPTPIMRAYGAAVALALPSGQHTITLVYDPVTYRVGALLSAITWSSSAMLALLSVWRNQRLPRQEESP